MPSSQESDDHSLAVDAGRRSVLKAAAWSVPVLAFASTVPEAAASTGSATLTFDNTTIQRFRSNNGVLVDPLFYFGFGYVQGNTRIENVYQPAETVVTSITLEISFDAQVPLRTDLAGTSIAGAGWALQGIVVDGGVSRYTFVWTGSLVSGAATSILLFRIDAVDSTVPDVDVPPFDAAWFAQSPQAVNTPTVLTSPVPQA